MTELITAFLLANPTAASIFIIMGVSRAVFKPLMSVLHAYADATESKEDNQLLSKFESSPAYKTIVYVLDWTTSIKIK
jgi:hypothetical protein